MGDRGQVLIEDSGVYLYTHYGASELVDDVRRALAKKWRWDDPEYLTRIILDEMIGTGEFRSETGYGIHTIQHGDIWRLIKISCEHQRVTIEDDRRKSAIKSFTEFIE